MESIIHDIQSYLLANDYLKALDSATKWLESFSLEERKKESSNYLKAKESYVYSTFFVNRLDRLHSLSPGKERASFFVECLDKLKELREEHGLIDEKHGYNVDTSIWNSIYFLIHSEISQSLAKDLAGQKSYHLKEEDILQLGFSLIETHNFNQAEESLNFLYSMNSRNPLANLLLAYVQYKLKDTSKVSEFFRDALFFNPEILIGYLKFLPGNEFHSLWNSLEGTEPTEEIKCRKFALLTEVHNLCKVKRMITKKELNQIETDFQILYHDHHQTPDFKQKILPRILHYLTWLIYYHNQYESYTKADKYQILMNNIDSEMYSIFQKNCLL